MHKRVDEVVILLMVCVYVATEGEKKKKRDGKQVNCDTTLHLDTES
jgi:hypothetical protein